MQPLAMCCRARTSRQQGVALTCCLCTLTLQGWKLVVTGHSLGAGVAALLSLRLRSSFPGKTAIRLRRDLYPHAPSAEMSCSRSRVC